MDDREYSNIFAIPPNYTDSGKLLGGMLESRNTVETAFLLLIAGFPQLMWLSIPAMAKAVVMTLTLLPLGIFGLMGIGGDSLMRFAVNMIRYFARRRKLHFRRIGFNYDKDKTPGVKPPKKKHRKL